MLSNHDNYSGHCTVFVFATVFAPIKSSDLLQTAEGNLSLSLACVSDDLQVLYTPLHPVVVLYFRTILMQKSFHVNSQLLVGYRMSQIAYLQNLVGLTEIDILYQSNLENGRNFSTLALKFLTRVVQLELGCKRSIASEKRSLKITLILFYCVIRNIL